MLKPYRCNACPLVVLALLALVMLQAATPALAQCERPSFTSMGGPLPLGTEADTEPRVLAAGNFFRRNDPARCNCDIAVALRIGNSERLVFLRGNDDGSFLSPSDAVSLDIDGPAVALAALGPVAGGRLDALAVLTGTTNASLAIYGPRADGTYVRQGPPRTVSEKPSALAVGDFNGDHKTDLVVASQNRPQLTVLLGDGTGGFLPESASMDLPGPAALAAGRFFGTDESEQIAVGTDDGIGGVAVAFIGWTSSGRLEILSQQSVGSGRDILLTTQRRTGPNDFVVAAFTVESPLQAGLVKILVPGTPPTVADVTTLLDRAPRALASADFNADGITDLVLSTYGDAVGADGRIRILKGSATGPQFEMLYDTQARPFRPKGLAIGGFGRNALTGQRFPGIAALDRRNNSAFVLRSNGANPFARLTGVRTEITRGDAAMFVVGDFHSLEGNSPVSDLGYLSRNPNRLDFEFQVLLANGNRGFHPAAAEPLPIGRQLMLISVGRFDDDKTNDIAVVDANPGDVQRRPLLTIFRGTGDGRFTFPAGLSEFLLFPGDVPVGIATGQFRGADPAKPLDIAVVAQTATGGRLTLFINNGAGVFQREEPSIMLPFKPGAIVVSNKFRSGNRYDVVIKHDGNNGFLFLRNAGNGQFVTQETFPDEDGGSFEFKRNDLFFAAKVDSDDFDDIVGFDGDGSLDIFTSSSTGTFRFANETPFIVPSQGPIQFDLKDAQFFLRDFGDQKPGLAGLVRIGSQPALVTLKGDGRGRFMEPTIELLELPVGTRSASTTPDTVDISHPEIFLAEPIVSAFAGQFANAQFGNGLPDLGFIVTARSAEVSTGKCEGDTQPVADALKVCWDENRPDSPGRECVLPCSLSHHNHCSGRCNLTPCTHPPCYSPTGSCVAACPSAPPNRVCEMRPATAFCRTTSAPLTSLIVVANSCNE